MHLSGIRHGDHGVGREALVNLYRRGNGSPEELRGLLDDGPDIDEGFFLLTHFAAEGEDLLHEVLGPEGCTEHLPQLFKCLIGARRIEEDASPYSR